MAPSENNGAHNGNGEKSNGVQHITNSGANGADGEKCPVKGGMSEVNGQAPRFVPTGATDGGPVSGPPKPKKEPGFFRSLSALKQLSKRPLPNAMGDGTYPVVQNRPKLKQDLVTISMKGLYS